MVVPTMERVVSLVFFWSAVSPAPLSFGIWVRGVERRLLPLAHLTLSVRAIGEVGCIKTGDPSVLRVDCGSDGMVMSVCARKCCGTDGVGTVVLFC